jgi:hypothetical protein
VWGILYFDRLLGYSYILFLFSDSDFGFCDTRFSNCFKTNTGKRYISLSIYIYRYLYNFYTLLYRKATFQPTIVA